MLDMETIAEKKRCSGCAKMRLVEMLKEGRKNCVKCAEKRRRQKQINCEYIVELERQIKEYQNKEEARESRQKYYLKNKEETITCPICRYDIEKYKKKKKTQHEQSKGHQFLAEQLANGIEFIEPYKKEMIDNSEHWKCKTCKLDIPYHSWGVHLKKKKNIMNSQKA